MAWVTEYDMTWRSSTKTGSIYLQRDGGTYQMPLKLAGGSLEIRNGFPSWEDPIARMNCSFTIINDLSDFYELMPLLTISAGQIRVVITDDTWQSSEYVIFVGYLNCETVSQAMMSWAPITLSASGYLSKLDNVHPTSIDVTGYATFIDLISSCLFLTGSTDPLYVNCELYEDNSEPAAGQTLFNRNFAFIELFWENNIERTSALEILTIIMKGFNCYLNWHNEKWYIQHYENLHQNKTYIIYDIEATYGYTDTGIISNVLNWDNDIHSGLFHKQVGDTQILNVNPGLKQLDISLDLKKYTNLFNPDLLEIASTGTAEPLLSQRRVWYGWDSASLDYLYKGKAFRNITNAVYRSGYDIVAGSNQMNGLSTRIAITAHSDTELVLSFKFGVYSQSMFWATGLAADRTINFYWYLCLWDATPANRDYFWYDTVAEEWSLIIDGDPEVDFNTLTITGADLDSKLHTYEGTMTIPIGSIISSSSGDEDHLDLAFRMGTELAVQAGETDKPANACYYGDFKAVINEETRNNLLQATVVTDFLDKKTVTLDLFDAGWSYRNSIFRYVNQYVNALAEDWTYDGSTIDSLENWILKSKFRLYRIARQKIVMTTYTSEFPMFGLLGIWLDNKQSDLPFAQLAVLYRPQDNTQIVELYEYDDTEDITLA